jgi:H+-transporting ATPase
MSDDVSSQPNTAAPQGLTSREAAKRLQEYGLNTVPQERANPLLAFFGKFWAPVPWMLEATIALQLLLGKTVEAIIIAVLLGFNSVLSFFEEAQSSNALALLRKRLSSQARVLRDGRWQLLAAQELVSRGCDSLAHGRHRSCRCSRRPGRTVAGSIGANRRIPAG